MAGQSALPSRPHLPISPALCVPGRSCPALRVSPAASQAAEPQPSEGVTSSQPHPSRTASASACVTLRRVELRRDAMLVRQRQIDSVRTELRGRDPERQVETG